MSTKKAWDRGGEGGGEIGDSLELEIDLERGQVTERHLLSRGTDSDDELMQEARKE